MKHSLYQLSYGVHNCILSHGAIHCIQNLGEKKTISGTEKCNGTLIQVRIVSLKLGSPDFSDIYTDDITAVWWCPQWTNTFLIPHYIWLYIVFVCAVKYNFVLNFHSLGWFVLSRSLVCLFLKSPQLFNRLLLLWSSQTFHSNTYLQRTSMFLWADALERF